MTEEKIKKLFEDLNIEVNPVSDNYTPEAFGKTLMAECYQYSGVSYSASTVVNEQQNNNRSS